jgi:hypothetical protein
MSTTLQHIRAHYILYPVIVVLLAICIALHMYLYTWLLEYVNDEVDSIPGYEGSVQDIGIDLYRGAYTIYGLKIDKKNGHIPTPFISIPQVDLAVQWKALFHGRIVSNIELDRPVLNFAVKNDIKQTGADVDWTTPIKNLSPVDINRVSFHDGKITYQDFSSHPQVDLYITHMDGEVSNLRNVVNASQPMPSSVFIKGDSIGAGKLEIKGRMNILKVVPDMDIDTKLENVHLPALNNYTNAYAAIDVKGGTLSVYCEFIIKNGHVSGYVKPIATHISLIDLHKDANPIKVTWEALATVVLKIFTNLHKDQFATKVELEGNIDHIGTSTWSAIEGILHNAFVSALHKGFDGSGKEALPASKQ